VVEAAARVEFQPRTEVTGRIVATDMVELRPRVSGHVQDVLFRAGQIVERDTVLFQIDPRWQQAAAEQARAEFEAATARVEVAEREQARAEKLAGGNAISVEELQARAARLLEARAAVSAAKAALESAKLDLEFTAVRAPIRGRIGRPLVTPGNYVSGVAGMTTLLATIVAVDPVHFYAHLDEASYLAFQSTWDNRAEGTKVPVHLQLADETGYPRTGFVESLDNHMDPGTGTVLMRAEFDNGDGRLLPGLYARAWLSVAPPCSVVMIDERAVGTDQNQKFVLVVDEAGRAAYRKIELGEPVDGRRVVRSGVAAGERVIVEGQVKARPGLPVEVVDPSAEKATTTSGR